MGLVAQPSVAMAQMAALDPYLMRPQLDGDPRHPPRFSRTTRLQLSDQGFTLQPGRGTTGFNSSSLRRPKAQQARSASLTQVTAPAQESAIGRPALRSAQSAAHNPNQGVRQNTPQQPHAATSANAAYPVGQIADPPALPARRRLIPDEDLFAPTAFHVGGFMLRPAMEA